MTDTSPENDTPKAHKFLFERIAAKKTTANVKGANILAELDRGIRKYAWLLNLWIPFRRRWDRVGFNRRLYGKYRRGFDYLDIVIETALSSGMEFQKAALEKERLHTDPKFGIILRMHAKAIRVSSEIFALLANGFSDCALVRWRTLLETQVAMIALRELGEEASIDFALRGRIESIKGMLMYQNSADEMNREKFSDATLSAAEEYLEKLLNKRPDLKQSLSWTRGDLKCNSWMDLIDKVGYGRWKSDYKLASQDLHSDYFREDTQIQGMTQGIAPVMLSGPSDTGLVEPAHMTAIMLSSITFSLITLNEDEGYGDIDFDPLVHLLFLNHYTERVGTEFLNADQRLYAKIRRLQTKRKKR
ncbi:MAG: DUF5677 domain-containing protein [Pseudomonadota bacterium]